VNKRFIEAVKKKDIEKRVNYFLYYNETNKSFTFEIKHKNKPPEGHYQYKANLHDFILSRKLKIPEKKPYHYETSDLQFEKDLISYVKRAEDKMHGRLKRWLDLYAPTVVYESNWRDGCLLINNDGKRQHMLGSPKGRPDFKIFNPNKKKRYKGFAIELKVSGGKHERMLKGELKVDNHLKQQIDNLNELKSFGWKTGFYFELDKVKADIVEYMSSS